jgi:hypothetical protein
LAVGWKSFHKAFSNQKPIPPSNPEIQILQEARKIQTANQVKLKRKSTPNFLIPSIFL